MFLSLLATRSLSLQKSICKVFSVQKVDLILWDLSIRRSFSPVPSTYGRFILILIFCFSISVACVSCYDWGKLWLLVILLRVLLIMLSWCPSRIYVHFKKLFDTVDRILLEKLSPLWSLKTCLKPIKLIVNNM